MFFSFPCLGEEKTGLKDEASTAEAELEDAVTAQARREPPEAGGGQEQNLPPEPPKGA